MKKIALLLFILLALPACHKQPTLTLVDKDKAVKFTLSELKYRLKPTTITIKNPIYGTPPATKTYDAFKLADILKLIHPEKPKSVLVFAIDRFVAPLDFTQLPLDQAYFAFKESGNPNGWEIVPEKEANPGPFWIVWSREGIATSYWPYQVSKIEVTSK